MVATGDELLIAEEGKALARLAPIPDLVEIETAPRIAGLHEGQGWMSDDFDAPLPDEFWAGRV